MFLCLYPAPVHHECAAAVHQAIHRAWVWPAHQYIWRQCSAYWLQSNLFVFLNELLLSAFPVVWAFHIGRIGRMGIIPLGMSWEHSWWWILPCWHFCNSFCQVEDIEMVKHFTALNVFFHLMYLLTSNTTELWNRHQYGINNECLNFTFKECLLFPSV